MDWRILPLEQKDSVVPNTKNVERRAMQNLKPPPVEEETRLGCGYHPREIDEAGGAPAGRTVYSHSFPFVRRLWGSES